MDNFLKLLLNEAGLKKAMKSFDRGTRNKEAVKQSLRAAKKRKEAEAREKFADTLKNNPDLRASVDMSRNSLKRSASGNTLNVRALNATLPGEPPSKEDIEVKKFVAAMMQNLKNPDNEPKPDRDHNYDPIYGSVYVPPKRFDF
jgi:hypothetical protein